MGFDPPNSPRIFSDSTALTIRSDWSHPFLKQHKRHFFQRNFSVKLFTSFLLKNSHEHYLLFYNTCLLSLLENSCALTSKLKSTVTLRRGCSEIFWGSKRKKREESEALSSCLRSLGTDFSTKDASFGNWNFDMSLVSVTR